MSHYRCIKNYLIDALCKRFLLPSWMIFNCYWEGKKQAPHHHQRSPRHVTYLQNYTITFQGRDSRVAYQASNVQKADPIIARNTVRKEMMTLKKLVIIIVVIIY